MRQPRGICPTVLLLAALCCCNLAAAPAPVPAEPEAPHASAAVQALLRSGNQYWDAHQLREALQAADQALEAARKAGDSVGEARSQRGRGRVLEDLGRPGEAVSAWQAAAAAGAC